MRVPLSWIKEYVDIADEPAEEIAQKLSMAGFEVEAIENPSEGSEGVLVGLVLSKEKHPNADKLSVCSVDIGQEKPLQIVCGATNVRSGIHVPVAPVGIELNSIDLKIKASKIRGIESSGMICSLRELGLESNSDGIAILEELTDKHLKPGIALNKLLELEDKIFDIAITANRPDGMSISGIVREVSALYKHLPIKEVYETDATLISKWNSNSKQDELGNSETYSLTFLESLNNDKETPQLIKKRLKQCGINSINTIVDITNYIMIRDGQPLHVFDQDRLEKLIGRKVEYDDFSINYANENELFIGLDNIEYKLNRDILVIKCKEKTIAVAGIIGSLETGVTKSTNRVVLEAAVFPQTLVRISSRKLGLRTESSSRFEKGIAEDLTIECAIRASNLLVKYCGAKYSETHVYRDKAEINNSIRLRKNSVLKTLGPLNTFKANKLNEEKSKEINMILDDKIVEDSLYSLGFKLRKIQIGWEVEVPPYRKKDITREIDLIEEIARIVGFDNFSLKLPVPIVPGGLTPAQRFERSIRDKLTSVGLQEVTTMSLVKNSYDQTNQITINNPFLAEASCLRLNLWEEHLEICSRNLKAFQQGCWIYEIGKIYQINKQKAFIESTILSGIICGEKKLEQWTKESKLLNTNYYRSRGLLEIVLKYLKLDIFDKQVEDQRMHPGRSSELILEGKPVGKFGQIHPELCEKYDLPNETYLFEFNYKQIRDSATRSNKLKPNFKKFPTVPFVERDISIIVDRSITSSQIISNIRKSGKPMLENVELIDRYEGATLAENKCSQTFRLRYRDKIETLTEKIIEPIHNKIRNSLIKQLKAELRS